MSVAKVIRFPGGQGAQVGTVGQRLKGRRDLESMLKKASAMFGLSVAELKKKNREGRSPTVIADVRAVVSYVARENLAMSYLGIGDMLNLDHTTIMRHCDRIESDLNGGDKDLEELLGELGMEIKRE